jgi:HAD superfamily hydrolase (TIGR01509 family)
MPSKKLNFKDHDLFVFDWDGTLNNMRLLMRINESLKRALGLWNKDSSIKDFTHVNYDLKKKLKNEEMKNDVLTYVFDALLNFSRPKLHPGTIKMLKDLRKRGKKIAVFSNGRSHRVIREMKILGITDYFDIIVSARDLNALKPNPTGLKAILSSLKAKAERSVYIGDMCDDIITAKLIHVHSCGLADGFDSYHRLKSLHPDFMMKNIEELDKAL